MGFGYVFLGCLFTCNITFNNYTDVFAVALMLLGLSTLAPYAKGFSLAFRAGMPLLAVSLVSFFLEIFGLLSIFHAPTVLISILAVAAIACKAVFFWTFFLGVEEIARGTELPKLRAHAMRSRFLTPIFAAMGLFLELDIFTTHTVFLKYFLLGYLLFGLIYALLNCKTVYECYILICYEGDETMDAPRRSLFGGKKNGDRDHKGKGEH